MIAAEHRPDRRILAAEPPQRDRAHPEPAEREQLIVRAGRVGDPHVVVRAFLVEAEAAVAARPIEPGHDARIARRHPRFLDRHRIGFAAAAPIIAVGRQRDDQLVRRHAPHRARDDILEPALRRDRAGRAALIMLVIGHQEQLVGDAGIRGQIPRVVVGRRGERDDPAAPGETGMRFGEEAAIVGLRRGGQLLEIEEGAVGAVGDEQRLDPVERDPARDRIAQQRRHARRVPIAVDRILDHRQQPRAMDRMREDRLACRIGERGEPMIGAGDRKPARDQPIELLDMPSQRGRAVVVPRRMKGDRERRAARSLRSAPQPPGIMERVAQRAIGTPGEDVARDRSAHRRPFHRERQLADRRHRYDRGNEDARREQDQQQERRHRQAEAPSPAARRIIEDRSIGHAPSVEAERRSVQSR